MLGYEADGWPLRRRTQVVDGQPHRVRSLLGLRLGLVFLRGPDDGLPLNATAVPKSHAVAQDPLAGAMRAAYFDEAPF